MNLNSTYIADVTRNVELLMQNVNTLPTILTSFSQHYNLGSLVTVVEALLTATAMQYGNIIPQNDIKWVQTENKLTNYQTNKQHTHCLAKLGQVV